MTEGLVTIARFTNVIDAEIARTKLESEGIQGFIADEFTSRVYPGAIDVRLLVHEEDAERAVEILQGNR